MKKSNLTKLFLMLCAMSVFMFGCTGGSGEESGILESIAVKLNFIPPVRGMRAGVVVGETKEGEDGLVYVVDRETGEATSYIVKDSKKGEKPVIEKIVQDKVKVAPGDTVKFRVTGRKGNKATEPAGKGKGKKSAVSSESLVYIWEALTGGTLSSNTGEEVEWTAPQQPGEYLLGVNIQDQDANEVGTNIIVPVGDQEVTSANKDSILSQLLSVLSKYNITGKVLDTDGNPVVNAEIATIPPTSQVLTAEDGTFTLADLNIGKYTVTAQKDGVGHDSTVAIITDEDRDVSFVISANNTPIAVIVEGGEQQVSNTYPLTGVVKDEEGNPVEGAIVAIEALSKLTTTDAMGIYNILAVQGGTHVLKVTKAGYEGFSEAVSVTTGAVKNVILEKSVTISGIVRDEKGVLLEGVSVILENHSTVLTNATGVFEFVDVEKNVTNSLSFEKDGFTLKTENIAVGYENISMNVVLVNASLLAYYSLDSTLTDITGNNNGTVNGTASYVAGIKGQAFNFDGSTQINIGNDLGHIDDFSIMLWVKYDSIIGSKTILASDNYTKPSIFFQIYQDKVRGYRNSYSTGAATPAGVWNHLTLTVSNNGVSNIMNIYINGVLAETATLTGGLGYEGLGLKLGAYSKNILPFKGSMDEIRIYSTVLSSAEVQATFNNEKPAE